MRIRIAQLLSAVLVLSSIGTYCHADIIVSSRSSTVTANVTWGNLDGPISFVDTKSENTMAQSLAINGADTGSGESGDIGWTASYTYDVAQDFTTTSNSIELGASFGLFSFYGGNGTSILSADNRIVVEFQNTDANVLQLSGALTPVSHMLFEQFDGVQWNTVYETTGSIFDQQFAVGAGSFRISADSTGSVDNFTAGESWNIKVTAVPEPGALSALAIVSAAGYFYKRRSKRAAQSPA